jgi:hypothetical protein
MSSHVAELLADLATYFRERPWHASALCAQTDPDAMFPTEGGQVVHAQRICGMCDVRAECLADSLDEPAGVWGGTSAAERERLRDTTDTAVDQWIAANTEEAAA